MARWKEGAPEEFVSLFDKDGNLTATRAPLRKAKRILPTGYWKGSGMAIALDLAAALLANGSCGTDMDEAGQGSCTGCCQIFIAFDPYMFGSKEEIQGMLNRRVKAADASHPEREGSHVTCPGERTVSTRARSMADGVNVDELVWEQVQAIAAGNLETEDIASR